MKILFESISGKKVEKSFKTLNEAKSFVLKNKKAIKEAQIMEGPLGSGGWTPKKAYKNFKKGRENYKAIKNINVKDSYNKDMIDYINKVLQDIVREEGKNSDGSSNLYGCGFNKHGFYICGGWFDTPNVRDIHDPEEGYATRIVSMDSEKYEEKVYMPKLTQYVKEHKSLPSEKQLKQYLEAVLEKRYNINFKKQKAKKPTRHLSRKDVQDF